MLLVMAENLEHNGLALDVLDEGLGHLHSDLAGERAGGQERGETPMSARPPRMAEHSRPTSRPLPRTGTLLAEILPTPPLIHHTCSGQTMGWVAFGLSPQDRRGCGHRAQLPFQNPELKKVTGQGASADWSDLGPAPTQQE